MSNGSQTASLTAPIERERLLKMLAVITFLIFFQAYMVAPIIPALAQTFSASEQSVALVVPAYLIPYGLATLAYGFLADRIGIHRVMFASLAAFTILAVATSTATSISQLTVWRIFTGLGASGVVPLALVTVGRLFPYEQRGRPLGWLFGAMAGGMALGSPLGAILVPLAGWRGLFVIVGIAGAISLVALQRHRGSMVFPPSTSHVTAGDLIAGYVSLLRDQRARRTYFFVFLNSMFHSGVFTWLGVYLQHRFGLGPTGIGLALLGYGIPGFVLGPVIGRAADRFGRARLIPIGLLLGSGAAAALLLRTPIALVPIIATILSLSYDTTQPLFAGIVTRLGGTRPGQAMGLNVFSLFVGFGVGSLLFGYLVQSGFSFALSAFALVEAALAIAALRAFRDEQPAARR